MSVIEIAKGHLLRGDRINKGDFHAQYKTFTLTQRIEEIRKEGWDVKSRAIPGRRGMVEYWLEPSEIERLKAKERRVEQLVEEYKNIAQNEPKQAQEEKYEQMGLGLLGTSNY